MSNTSAHLGQFVVNDKPVRGGVQNIYLIKYTVKSAGQGDGSPKAELCLVIKAPRADKQGVVSNQEVTRYRNAMKKLSGIEGVQLPLYISDQMEMISYRADGTLDHLRLNQSLAEPAPLTLEHVKQLVTAVMEVHQRGMAHGDIKPENITYFNKNNQVDQVKLIDWDQARDKDSLAGDLPRDFHGTDSSGYVSKAYADAATNSWVSAMANEEPGISPFSIESLQCADFCALGQTLRDLNRGDFFPREAKVQGELLEYIDALETIRADGFENPQEANSALAMITSKLTQLLTSKDELVVGNKETKAAKATTSKKGNWLGYGGLALAAIGCGVSIGVGIVAQAAVTSAIILIPSIALVVMALMVVGYGLNKKTSSSKPDDLVDQVYEGSKSTKSNLSSSAPAAAHGELLTRTDVVGQVHASAPAAAHGKPLTRADLVDQVYEGSKSTKSNLSSSHPVAPSDTGLTETECKTILTDFRSMKDKITIYDRFGRSQDLNDSFDADNPSTAQIKTQLAMNPKWPEQYRPQQEAQKPVFDIMDSGGWAGLEVPSTTCRPAKTEEFIKPLAKRTPVRNSDLEKFFAQLMSDTDPGKSPGGKRPGS